jgi:hypothetical protein
VKKTGGTGAENTTGVSVQKEETVFERTYRYYLHQLKAVSFKSVAPKLGAKLEGDALKIALFGRDFEVSTERIIGPSGEKPAYDICVILSKYILRCPDKPQQDNDWVSFRNFKDAGPLVNYFSHDVEHAAATFFSEKIAELHQASSRLGGYPPALDVRYDFAVQFDALPMIPVVLLYNDRDEEFPASCSLLFERRTETYLDAESIAMLGRQLVSRLKKKPDVANPSSIGVN